MMIFFDAVLLTFIVLRPPFIKVKTKKEAVLMCGSVYWQFYFSKSLDFSTVSPNPILRTQYLYGLVH